MSSQNVQQAAKTLKDGGLVVFPTETVYGLGANALLPESVQNIYTVKGRAQDNPLIVHIGAIDDLQKICKNIPDRAYALAKEFWPGPLTLVLEKQECIPNIVSAGGDTVGVRIPNNDIALELIESSGVPVVAPSANLSGKPSPTNVHHIKQDLEGKVDIILDGGNTSVGLESTVVDISGADAVLLRPGGVSLEELQEIIPEIRVHPKLLGNHDAAVLKSPGMKYRHYAPKAELILAYNGKDEILDLIELHKAKKIGVLCSEENKKYYRKADTIISLGSSQKLKVVAQNLFHALRQCDTHNVDIIFSETFSSEGLGMAIMDRLIRASEK